MDAPISFDSLRRLVITALFSDDFLFERLVLKGGSALSLVHEVSSRASFDIDFSMCEDFDDLAIVREKAFHALKARFESVGLVSFDERFEPKPRIRGEDKTPSWGGYELTFKLVEAPKFERLRDTPRKMQINALPVGVGQERVFRVEISKNEFVDGSLERDLDHFTIRVYSLAMIAVEKLRALCQQLPEYEVKRSGRARARDFYDIHLIISTTGVHLDSPENLDLLASMFAAKQVRLELLGLLEGQREFHRPDWPDVVNQVSGPVNSFDFYFDFVISEVERLKPFWNI